MSSVSRIRDAGEKIITALEFATNSSAALDRYRDLLIFIQKELTDDDLIKAELARLRQWGSTSIMQRDDISIDEKKTD